MRRLALLLIAGLAVLPAVANEARPRPAPDANQAADARRKQLEIALADVCARHRTIERCFLVLAKDASGRPGLWFVPVFDGAADPRALGEAQQAWTRLVPGGGQIPMMLMPGTSWRTQLQGVPTIYRRAPLQARAPLDARAPAR
jgi:hypothetical protein